jgi:hypothetical protein
MLGERLDIVDAKLGCDFGGELQEIHAGKFRIAIAIVWDVDVGTKRIGGDGDTIARRGGEHEVWAGLAGCREGGRGSASEDAPCSESGKLFKERSSG